MLWISFDSIWICNVNQAKVTKIVIKFHKKLHDKGIKDGDQIIKH